MEKSDKIQILTTTVMVFFFLAVTVSYVRGVYFGLPHPYNMFLWGNYITPCGDFLEILPLIKDLNIYLLDTPWKHGLPWGYLIFYPFAFVEYPHIAYFILAGIFTVIFAFLNYKFFHCENLPKMQNIQNIFILTLMSYPFLHLLDRGNSDMLLFLMLAAFISLFKKEKYRLGAVLLALMSAIKPVFIIFIFLFFGIKKFKEPFLACLLAFALTIAGFKILEGGYLEQLISLIYAYKSMEALYLYSDNHYGLLFHSCLLSMLKALFCKLIPIATPLQIVSVYKVISTILSGVILTFTCLEKQFWKKVLLLTVFTILIPPASVDYKLIFLFVPLWLFISDGQTQSKKLYAVSYTVLFALLLIPKSFIIFQGTIINEGVLINPILMLIFCGLIIYETTMKKIKP